MANGELIDEGLEVVAVNRSLAMGLLDDDSFCEIKVWIDGDSEETEDRDEAIAAVAYSEKHDKWLVIDLTAYEYQRH